MTTYGQGLPPGWSWATPRDLASPERYALAIGPFGSNLKVSDYTDEGVPLVFVRNIRAGVFGDSKTRYITPAKATALVAHAIRAGDVLITKMGDPPGDSCVYPPSVPDAVITADCIKLRVNPSLAEAKFVSLAIRSDGVHRRIVEVTKGVAQQKVSLDRFSQIHIPLCPLPEQRRIVAKIEELFSDLDAGVAVLKRVRANLKRYRATVLKAAVDGRLTEEWRTRNPVAPEDTAVKLLERILLDRRAKWEQDQLRKFKETGKTPPKGWKEKYEDPALPNDVGVSTCPSSWCLPMVKHIGRVQLGRQRAPQHHSGTHMRPYLRVANVFENRIDTSDVMEMNFTPDEFETYGLIPKDILLNEGQSMELVGRPAMYRNEVPGACFTNTLVRFQAGPAVSPEFALLVFLAYLKNGRFQKIATITVNIAHLGAGRFAELDFPLPPLTEQSAIVAEVDRRLSVADAAEQQVEHALQRAARLRQSILKRAFEGKLVPQDPTDEPASALLERLKRDQVQSSREHAPRRASRRGVRTGQKRRSRKGKAIHAKS